LETHTATLSDICGKSNRNWKTVLRQRAKELREIKNLEEEFGISMALDGVKESVQPEEQDEE
jgi:hypothetical protein